MPNLVYFVQMFFFNLIGVAEASSLNLHKTYIVEHRHQPCAGCNQSEVQLLCFAIFMATFLKKDCHESSPMMAPKSTLIVKPLIFQFLLNGRYEILFVEQLGIFRCKYITLNLNALGSSIRYCINTFLFLEHQNLFRTQADELNVPE